MELIKKQSKMTYKNKEGKEKHYYNFYLVLENGKQVQVRASFTNDNKTLDAVAKYVG